jgi:hypothetical protein
MPYIKQTIRELLDANRSEPATAGELNYKITRLCLDYIATHGKQYNTYNEAIGVLSCVTQELYRRQVAPYEDQKIAENGDVV